MCYHTTFLFSLCGHIAISPEPVRNTQQCSQAKFPSTLNQRPKLLTSNLKQAVQVQQDSSTRVQKRSSPTTPKETAGRLSYHSITSPFPSPQEFEFAQQIHDESVPASPSSPRITRVLRKQDSQSNSSIHTDIISGYAGSSLTHLELDDRTHATNSCTIITRHPMHTYILPYLCSSCRLTREQNMARFELQTMKEAIDRENWGYRKDGGPMGIIDSQRKRIHRRSAGKGKLIPLICVEENRIGKEALKEQALDDELKRQSQLSNSTATQFHDTESDQNVAADEVSSVGGSSVLSATSNSKQDSFPQPAAALPSTNPISIWGRSWWSSKSTNSSVPYSATISQPSTPLPQISAESTAHVETPQRSPKTPKTPVKNTNRLREQTQADSIPAKKTGMDVDWSHTQETWRGINNEVTRDVHGRNAGAMSRIMASDTGGANIGVKRS